MARGRIPTGTSPLCSQMRVLADVTVEVILVGTTSTPHLVFSFSMSFGIPLCVRVCSPPTCPDPRTHTLVLVSSLFLSVSLPHHASSMHHRITICPLRHSSCQDHLRSILASPCPSPTTISCTFVASSTPSPRFCVVRTLAYLPGLLFRILFPFLAVPPYSFWSQSTLVFLHIIPSSRIESLLSHSSLTAFLSLSAMSCVS